MRTRVAALRCQVADRGFVVDADTADSEQVARALAALAPGLVLEAGVVRTDLTVPEHVVLMAHFRNEVLHVFAAEAVAATALALVSGSGTLQVCSAICAPPPCRAAVLCSCAGRLLPGGLRGV